MRSRKGRKRSETPELRFRRKLTEEYMKAPGMMVKVERMPQGSMAHYRVQYVHASQLDPRDLEIQMQEYLGSGTCLLRFVDETRQPLDEHGSMWIFLGHHDDLEDRLEKAQFATNITVLKSMAVAKQKSRDADMEYAAILPALIGKIRRNRSDARLVDVLKRSMNAPRRDNSEAVSQAVKATNEMREQENQRIVQQRAETAKQLPTLLDPIVTKMQEALQGQEVECEIQVEPVEQGHQFRQEDGLSLVAGLSLQRLKADCVVRSLRKPQEQEEDDQ